LEVCQGGIITVEIKNSAISVIGKEWILKMVLNVVVQRNKAKEFTRKTVLASESRAEYKLDDFICELATIGLVQ
jgi:hypothetical protein